MSMQRDGLPVEEVSFMLSFTRHGGEISGPETMLSVDSFPKDGVLRIHTCDAERWEILY